jgi:hypothetical protein
MPRLDLVKEFYGEGAGEERECAAEEENTKKENKLEEEKSPKIKALDLSKIDEVEDSSNEEEKEKEYFMTSMLAKLEKNR